MNAILHLLRTACPWRYLPRDGFSHRATVYNIFCNCQRSRTWEAIWVELHMALHERMGREASPSAAVLDSQSVKSAEKGTGKTTRWVYDAGKKVKGRKIHAWVDGEGLPMRSSSTPLPFKIATGPIWCSTRSADVSAFPVARTDLGR